MIPYTDYEKLLLLKELEDGEKVIIPCSLEHADFMKKVAQDYIDNHKRQMMEILKGNK